MNDRFLFRAFYQGRFIYKNLIDANYYTYDNRCIGLANTLPNSLKWEQCTGLKDKNGKLIYEGDIFKSPQGIYTIAVDYYGIWDVRDEFGYVAEWSDFVKNYLIDDDNKEIEVIGNIHQDKDLIDFS